jgi:hypothetical protein
LKTGENLEFFFHNKISAIRFCPYCHVTCMLWCVQKWARIWCNRGISNANQSDHMNGNALICFTEQFYRTKWHTSLIWIVFLSLLCTFICFSLKYFIVTWIRLNAFQLYVKLIMILRRQWLINYTDIILDIFLSFFWLKFYVNPTGRFLGFW